MTSQCIFYFTSLPSFGTIAMATNTSFRLVLLSASCYPWCLRRDEASWRADSWILAKVLKVWLARLTV